ncbi:hypothetical protein [Streptomyces canus]|nr:hypothetical protein [Streptomyces canus]MDQ1065762.1 hypothetical protein [Streptomyces canus]
MGDRVGVPQRSVAFSDFRGGLRLAAHVGALSRKGVRLPTDKAVTFWRTG